ncbi:MAG: homoserine dehydrogenase [Hyphomicrobiaceae bacterium]
MKQPLIIGIAGLGTVGTGLLSLLDAHGTRLSRTIGREIRIGGVSARSREKHRGSNLETIPWFDDPVDLARAPGIDVFVELIGGDEGPPRIAVETALRAKKHVVTANKALLAKHGEALAALAEANGVELNFEAAVAGGIPVIKTLREALAANEIQRVYGILNGTCNYILTKMQEESRPFASVLGEAQAKGYAEADPAFDIGGFDAAHKLTLLASLAFGTRPALDAVHVEGIQNITAADIEAADDFGYRIKLLGVATRTASGIEARVTPVLVDKDSAIAQVGGVTNCVAIEGDFAGNLMLIGPGAGARATASAVASDILDIAHGGILPPFLTPVAQLRPHTKATIGQHTGAYYIRLSVVDKPGALATIAKRMGDQFVSLESLVQKKPRAAMTLTLGSPPASVILITHPTNESAIRTALTAIEQDGNVSERPQMIRIEKL